MNVLDIPKEVIQRLCLEFQDQPDGDTFERILFRVDRLIQSVMKREQRRWAHLRSEDPQDLYQASCIGLCNAIGTVKFTETSNQTILRIIAYVQAEIRKEFPLKRNKFCTRGERITEEPVYRQLESECLHDVFLSLIAEGVLTEKEYNIMCQRCIEGTQWKIIASAMRMNIDSAKQMLYAAQGRARHQLRIRGITLED